ncbi:bifunctional phosphopantothenoylcysteine decarboxylase/phosphopantothenate--cysteine ligase CoaBC [Corynebacterium terpenotabidum]|uniref:bifunctional phosphopantothenoylcysteine decarboxylase/phosphopantothenate--cysteine ligase CoaBC n=1 Tax=Corynebacterium terpenotabidum TaxID=89154 RepID=UPI0005A13934|nr:bifunctional phosphopantothenoylcysteine decarboxylase/phosphopantothenate--cysteine ligase CoaBC [Corynebacterium terpenotabidum]
MNTGASGASGALRILVGVGGGIAAYKACALIRTFTKAGHDVHVVPTEAALKFVGTATFEALSGNPVTTTVFEDVDEVRHVRLGQEADLVVIAPATADLMARLAHGRADDLITASCLVATCPVVLAPAMHTEMWAHPATRENVETLRRRGTVVLDPAHGRLTGPDSGAGRMPEPEHIAALALAAHDCFGIFRRSLVGRRILITAGGTHEPLDPVRFLGNASSGRQGFALADVAVQRGARVEIIAGYTDDLPEPSGATVTRVRTAREMQQAVVDAASSVDAVIMSAAVADFRPASAAEAKLKKGGDTDLSTLSLTENPDILRGLVEARRTGELPEGLLIAGFAAETGDADHTPLDLARAKLARKGCDLLMCNAVGDGLVFGQDSSSGWLLTPGDQPGAEDVTEVPAASKLVVASHILDALDELFAPE